MVTTHQSKAMIIILSAPSGGGKTSIAKKLLHHDPNLRLSISATTRSPRPGEIEGEHYFFCSEEEFKQMQKNDALLESAQVYGNYYGTPIKFVQETLADGHDVLFDIDCQGALQIQSMIQHGKLRSNFISIFIKPPSLDILKNRLITRDQDSADVIIKRLAEAEEEIKQAYLYDYIIVNDDYDTAVTQVQTIISNARGIAT